MPKELTKQQERVEEEKMIAFLYETMGGPDNCGGAFGCWVLVNARHVMAKAREIINETDNL